MPLIANPTGNMSNTAASH